MMKQNNLNRPASYSPPYQGGVRGGFPNNYNRMLSFLILIYAIPFLAIHAAHKVEVIKSGDTISIRLPVLDGASGAEATKILSSDLERSGWFKVVATEGDYFLQGTASTSSVQCKLFKRDGSPIISPNGSGDLRQAIHKVADEIVAKLTGKKGIAQTHIAFISDKSGKKELYAMDYDGGKVQRFTTDKSLVVAPNFNYQGNKIAYTSYRSSFPDVYVMGYPAGKVRVVSNYPGLNSGAAFSPDGSRLALTLSKDGNPELYTMSVDGENLKRLTHTRGGESSPTWSPDGGQIAYSSDEGGRPQIYIIPSSGGSGKKLTSSPAYNTEPDWSPDGKQIAYSSSPNSSQWAISALDLQESGGRGKEIYSDGNCEDPSWAPDGRHLVFSRTTDGYSNLYILDTITKEATQLTRDFGNCTQPTWSKQ